MARSSQLRLQRGDSTSASLALQLVEDRQRDRDASPSPAIRAGNRRYIVAVIALLVCTLAVLGFLLLA